LTNLGRIFYLAKRTARVALPAARQATI
jgi:hypothetical protein